MSIFTSEFDFVGQEIHFEAEEDFDVVIVVGIKFILESLNALDVDGDFVEVWSEFFEVLNHPGRVFSEAKFGDAEFESALDVFAHIAVSVMTERLKPRAKTVIYIFGYLISLVLFALITWQSVMYGLRLFNSGEESLALGIPSYPFAFVVALGTAFTCLVLLANLIETIAEMGER